MRGPGLDLRYLFRIDRPRWFEAKDSQAAAIRYVDGIGDEGGTLLDLLHDSPPAFFSADLARLDGDVLAPAPVAYVPFDPARIEAIDWAAAKVDPLLEKGHGGAQRSLFEWVEARLAAGAADVIFNDDDTGEIADFVALYARGQAPPSSSSTTARRPAAAPSLGSGSRTCTRSRAKRSRASASCDRARFARTSFVEPPKRRRAPVAS